MTSGKTNGAILVTGGTGKTGRRVAERLAARGKQVRIGSRASAPRFDWAEPTSWAPALEGVEAIYVVYLPDVSVPGAVETLTAFYRQAKAAGVKKAVHMLGRGASPSARSAEAALQQSGLEWTIVRVSWFFQNFDEGSLSGDIKRGLLALPVGEVKEPFVDADDIADVAAAALTEPGHAGKIYDVTGPELLTFGEAVSQIASIGGVKTAFKAVPVEVYRQILTDAHVPAPVIAMLCDLFVYGMDGSNATLGDGVQQALKRQPKRFADFVAQAARSGAWS